MTIDDAVQDFYMQFLGTLGNLEITYHDPQAMIDWLRSTLKTFLEEKAAAIEAMKISHMADKDYPHDDCLVVTQRNAALSDAAAILRKEINQ